jgi:BirA family biotin operon repressor/biotin-[acetyl-CoA-carboxylase] ligase
MKTKGERVNYVVIGVGINANVNVKEEFPEELITFSTSIENELGKKIRLEELLKLLLEKLDSLYGQFLREGFSRILEKWKKYAVFLGKAVEVVSGTERLCGLALDVDDEGALIVRLENGTVKHVFVGDVSLVLRS